MWKVLIADDEPKIRRGVRNLICWEELGMEVVGEAEDGEIALEVAEATQPDILLVDICMPFVNGLQFIEQLKYRVDNCIVIIITGHDEFSYAQKAIKLQVFDYLLKPITKGQLQQVLEKASQTLAESRGNHRYLRWVSKEKGKNLKLLRDAFCKEWMHGKLDSAHIQEQLEFLDLILPAGPGMLVVKVAGRFSCGQLLKEWDQELLLFAIENIVTEMVADRTPNLLFWDDADNLVVVTPINSPSEWYRLGAELQQAIEKCLGLVVLVLEKPLTGDITGFPGLYKELVDEINQKVSCTPIVLLSQKYIETHYYKEELSLQDLAQSIQISPTYLSRLLKSEIGVSFIEYLTYVRVQKAMQLMSDPTVKIYEVAERVGYSNQHYFSTAFKKVVGLSPVEYRKRGSWR